MGCGASQEFRVVMLGIGAAGKTTILYRLKDNRTVRTVATVGFTLETVTYGDLEFNVWDLGGQDKIRPLWHHYYKEAHGVIFVIDSSDRERFPMAKIEFHKMAQARELRGCPILVLANKQDQKGAATAEEVETALDAKACGPGRAHVVACCALTGVGLAAAMQWLSDQVRGGRRG